MKILITGSKGFIGKNLITELKNQNYSDILEYDIENEPLILKDYCKEADFVFHLAGVNRPKAQSEFMPGNFGLTEELLRTLKEYNNKCPVMLASSTQAELDNLYGKSKKKGEEIVFQYSKKTGAEAIVYRFPNIFGKWCRPNYNSVVATFCHNIANDLPIQINDYDTVLNLVYIDDVVQELIAALKGNPNKVSCYCEVPVVHTIKLGKLAELIQSFKESRKSLLVPNMSDAFIKKLYSTYLSYLPEDGFSYPLKMNEDSRGSFTEFIKTSEKGQVSINISKPGIVKGNHWHHTKNEKFLVVSGTGIVRFRKVGTEETIEYEVCGSKLEVIDIPPGYTHNIENTGATDMVTVMWANEQYEPERPDTHYLEV